MSGMFGGGGGPPGFIKKTLFTNYQGAGDSSFQPKSGILNIDPRFEELRNQYLGGVQDLQSNVGALTGFGGRFSGLGSQLGQNTAGARSQFSGIPDQFGALGARGAEDYGALRGGYRQLGQEFAGNQGALINARMNPLRGQVARAEGGLKESIGRRGLGGTSFGNQAMTNFATDTGRALSDAEAMATAEALMARQGLLGAEQSALGQQLGFEESALTSQQRALIDQVGLESAVTGQQASLLGQEMTAEQASIQNDAILSQLLGESSAQFLAQELEAIGLGANITNALLGQNVSAENTAQQAKANKLGATMKLAGGLAGGFGSLLTADALAPSGGVTSMPSVFNNPYSYNTQPFGSPSFGFGGNYRGLTI